MESRRSFANSKDIKFVITLANQKYFSSGGQKYDTITLKGLRASVFINNAGGAMMGTLNAQIYGISAEDMNALTSPLWDVSFITNPDASAPYLNLIQVFAIDGSSETLVYNGQVVNAWGVYDSMPNTYLYIQAMIAPDQLVKSASPLSIAADTDINTVMAQIVSQMGFKFENNGVTGAVTKGSYFANTLMEQARNLMQAYGFAMYIDNTSPNTVAITPFGKARNMIAANVSPQTGLVGYPQVNKMGINFDTLFNPDITFGGPVIVNSSIALAKGTWNVRSMSHSLSSQTPNGPWLTTVSAILPIGGFFGGL